jgi:hypothetical protein
MTIKELAAELGKSKTYIVNVIDELGLKGDLAFVGNKYDVPAETADKIRQHINGKSSPTTDTDTAAMTALIEQLQAKDAMIERLQQENMELVKTLQQHTYLLAQSTAPQQQEPIETDPEPTETISNENKGLWSRIFGR